MMAKKATFTHEQVAAVSVLLREPQHRARRLLAANQRWLAELEHRHDQWQPERALRRHVARLRFPQRSPLLELLGEDPRPRIVTSYHFGDYVYGLNLLAASIGSRAKLRYLVRAPGSAAHFANMKRAFGERAPDPAAQLLAREACAETLLPLLRRDGTQFVTFCDPEKPLGARVQVGFLHRAAWFSRAPALLGLTNRIPLLPVINWFDGSHEHVVLGEQIEPERLADESLAEAVQRITAELVRFFEPFFRSNPEQWRHLPSLPLYFLPAETAGAMQQPEESHASAKQDTATARPLRR